MNIFVTILFGEFLENFAKNCVECKKSYTIKYNFHSFHNICYQIEQFCNVEYTIHITILN